MGEFLKSIIEKDLSLMCSVPSAEGKLISVVRVKHNYRKLSAHEIKKVARDIGKTEEELKKMYFFEPEVYINEDEYNKIILSAGGENFTIEFDILSKDKKVGTVSVSNIYVMSKKEIRKFIDTRPAESKCIAERICNEDFKDSKELDIVFIDNFVIEEEYQQVGLIEVTSMIETFINTGICEIEKVYIRALSMTPGNSKEKDETVLNGLQRIGYNLLDEDYLMLKKLNGRRVY